MRSFKNRAFTLIELLTVMAISAILLGLIVAPLFQSFNLTRTAQAFADAQDRARSLTERIAGEISGAVQVNSNATRVLTRLNGKTVVVSPGTLVIQVPSSVGGKWPGNPDAPYDVQIEYSKIDIVPPAENPTRTETGDLVDPITGKVDPTLRVPKGQVALPAGPGQKLVRYFIALRDPFLRYNNPYDGLLMVRGGGRDNLFMLYRAEIVPYVWRNNKSTPGDNSTRAWRPNLAFFATDSTDTQIVDPSTIDPSTGAATVVGFDDPRFMIPDADASGAIISDETVNEKAWRIKNWLRIAVAGTPTTVPTGSYPQAVTSTATEVSRYDMVMPVYDKSSRQIKTAFDAGVEPIMVPLVQFRPSHLNSEPAEPMAANRLGDESDTALSVGPDVYTVKHGHWQNPIIRVFPSGWVQNEAANDDYLVAHPVVGNSAKPMSLFAYNPDINRGQLDTANALTRELFDIGLYERRAEIKRQNPNLAIFPFTDAVLSANANSNFLANAALRRIFRPVHFDAERGLVVSSFGIDEVGNSTGAAMDFTRNLPTKETGDAIVPGDASFVATGSLGDVRHSTINGRFNKVYNDYPFLRAGNVHRYIDLGMTPNSDGTPGPLYRTAVGGQPTGFFYTLANGARRSNFVITPGSEVVIGPDQLGPNYGQPVRYRRASTGEPGPNEYKINYTDLPEPVNATGAVDYTVLFPELRSIAGVSTGVPPANYNPRNLLSAVLQPRFKAGYIQLYSGADAAIPAGVFQVYYRFQATGTRVDSGRAAAGAAGTQSAFDTIAVDYDTRELIDVFLTLRNYPQSNTPDPQTVTLKSTAAVRNFSR